jgi:hypothetical protein
MRRDVLQPDGVAIGRRLDDEIARDGRAGTGLVFHDDLLAELLAHRDGDRTPEHIGDSAGGETDHHADRFVGVIRLCPPRCDDK